MSSALVAASFTSCKNVEEDIWNESSIERLEKVKVEYADILRNAENGWEMQYFPNASTPGYIMAVKFLNDGSVIAAADNRWTDDKYKLSDASSWSINIDNGPVLSFDTYNSIIHIFSDPNSIPGTDYGTGLGMEGDYEFIMIDVPEDGVIVLKGKKRGTYAYLRRISKDISWEDFLGTIKSKQQTIVADNPSPMLLTVGDKQYNMWYKKKDNLLNIVPIGGDTIAQEKLFHYTFNSTGLYLLEPFDLDGADNLQWFDADNADWTAMTKMIAKKDVDGEKIEGATITAGNPFKFFNEQLDPTSEGGVSASNWNITLDEARMSAENLAKFKAVDELLGKSFTSRAYAFTSDYSEAVGGTALQITLKRTGQPTCWIRIAVDRAVGENTIVLNAKVENGAYKYAVTSGYEVFFNNFMTENSAAVSELMSIFANAEFNIDFDSHTTLRTVKMNNTQSEASWFIVESSYIRR